MNFLLIVLVAITSILLITMAISMFNRCKGIAGAVYLLSAIVIMLMAVFTDYTSSSQFPKTPTSAEAQASADESITTVQVGTGTITDSWAAEMEGSGLTGTKGTGLAIGKIANEYGDYSYAVLSPQDLAQGNNVEIVAVYHGRTRIATIARRPGGWDKPTSAPTDRYRIIGKN